MRLEAKIAQKTDEILEEYLRSYYIYTPDTIEVAYNVLKSRGRLFSENEEKEIMHIIENKRNVIKENNKGFWFKDIYRNIVKDENAPELYSRLSIMIFSVVFMVAIGGYLQALNAKSVGNKKGFYLTALFAILYTIFQVVIFNYFNISQFSVTYAVNIIAVAFLDYYFWNKYIGKEIQYRTKSIVKPLIISILIIIPIVLSIIYG